jgi:hypothetical protein
MIIVTMINDWFKLFFLLIYMYIKKKIMMINHELIQFQKKIFKKILWQIIFLSWFILFFSPKKKFFFLYKYTYINTVHIHTYTKF